MVKHPAAETLPSGTVTFLFTDIEGSTRLWESDPDAMRIALARHDQLIGEAIESSNGFVFKTVGDAFCAAFAVASDAVRAALDAQLAMHREHWPEPVRIRVRMAIHSGAAELRDRDYFGPPLNLVARLLSVGHGGQTLMTTATYSLCGLRMPPGAAVKSLGEHVLKDLPQRQRIYQLTHPELPEANEPLTTVNEAGDADKPSIAVLPFANLSGDPEQAYFADGVVDDIITALSRVRAFFVIARTSSFTYRDRAVDVKTIARELAVRYVLEGSIRRAGNRIRITGQLIEAENSRHIWADRFEGELHDLFELQDRMTASVVGAVEPSLRLAEVERARAKPTANLQAYDYVLRAWRNLSLDPSLSGNDQALFDLRRAIELDANYSLAKALYGWAIQLRNTLRGITASERSEGTTLAREALAAHRDDPVTLATAAWALCYLDSAHDEAMDAADRALELAPNVASVLNHAGWTKVFAGDANEAVAIFERAMRLSPRDPQTAHLQHGLAIALARAGRVEEALAAAERARRERPQAGRVTLLGLVELGRLAEARALALKLHESSPSFTLSWFRAVPFRDQTFKNRCIAAWRAAGVPE
ncbi:MAG TPA: adenylate/guanylate cyclase domain-containing protein [Casimicrobiaceae bacterium]|nr:adenylate/guanylate cyclase domain-containing protein [Casimicrobiaceae bacterium]